VNGLGLQIASSFTFSVVGFVAMVPMVKGQGKSGSIIEEAVFGVCSFDPRGNELSVDLIIGPNPKWGLSSGVSGCEKGYGPS